MSLVFCILSRRVFLLVALSSLMAQLWQFLVTNTALTFVIVLLILIVGIAAISIVYGIWVQRTLRRMGGPHRHNRS